MCLLCITHLCICCMCFWQCYYMGVGDKEQGTAGGVKREISGSFQRGINAKRLCTRLKKKDAQMCELRYEKKIDVKNTDLKKLRVKELRKILDDEGVSAKGLVEKDEFINKIKTHFGIKDDL
uniref:Mesencephalic astrocyte-derived neurotrophic factor homolog n=1 Tax=Chrysotila carterae TaxID=13221 RepID=A0A7S4BW38_CHRCT